jgi:hypothetical protein
MSLGGRLLSLRTSADFETHVWIFNGQRSSVIFLYVCTLVFLVVTVWPWATICRNSILHISRRGRWFRRLGGGGIPYHHLFVGLVAKPRNNKSRAVSSHIPYSWDSAAFLQMSIPLFGNPEKHTLLAEEFAVLYEESRGPLGWSEMFTRAELNKSRNIFTVCVLLCIMISSI